VFSRRLTLTRRRNVRTVIRNLTLALILGAMGRTATLTISEHRIIVVNGKPAFPIGFMWAPPPESKTPTGRDAYEELKSNGIVWQLVGPTRSQTWDAEAESKLDRTMELSAKAGLLTGISIYQLQTIGPNDQSKTKELRRVVEKYKRSPSLAFWKALDEPAWSRVPADVVKRYADTIREMDPDHLIWMVHAPRGTVASLRPYNAAADIIDTDVYPISYPPGVHSLGTNKDISMVGDYAKKLQQITEGKKPFFMTLQICWSGVTKPGRTLRMPTFPQERYMAYEAIIGGARGLVFYGGNVQQCQNARDRSLGWNWTFYERVLKPVLDELNPDAPLYPALVGLDASVNVTVSAPNEIEYLVREAGGYLYLLASKRDGATINVRFSGLPATVRDGEVLYEAPRRVAVSAGQLSDWFAPHDVHVYRFKVPESAAHDRRNR
jgi:hypothetical protein